MASHTLLSIKRHSAIWSCALANSNSLIVYLPSCIYRKVINFAKFQADFFAVLFGADKYLYEIQRIRH